MKNELKIYIKENLVIENEVNSNLRNGAFLNKLKSCFFEEEFIDIDYEKSKKTNYVHDTKEETIDDIDISDFLKNKETVLNIDNSNISSFIEQKDNYNDFQTLLFKMIDERNLKDSDVYNKVHIDRRLFSKIRSDKNYHPSKETIVLLGLSLELNEDEIIKLLDSASYSLPKNNYYDLIIRFCFINKIYKLTEVNELLEEYNCKLFNY